VSFASTGHSVGLWDFAVAIHAAPGVDEGLIDLQDNHGQCVSYLLWAVWTARCGRAADDAILTKAAALARNWEAEVTAPLRAARRALKRDWTPVPGDAREALRSDVKAGEFAAERLLLEALEALTASPGPVVDVRGRLMAAASAWAEPAPIAAIEPLLPIFESFAI
jgi:uncharacterized protein (TIGR02444 family)